MRPPNRLPGRNLPCPDPEFAQNQRVAVAERVLCRYANADGAFVRTLNPKESPVDALFRRIMDPGKALSRPPASVVSIVLAVLLLSGLCGMRAGGEELHYQETWPLSSEEATEWQYQFALANRIPVRQTNSIDMLLMLVPPGQFDAGSTKEERLWALAHPPEGMTPEAIGLALEREKASERIVVEHPFLMGAHPVTTAQFAEFVRTTGYRTAAEKAGAPENWRAPGRGIPVSPQHPVTRLTRADAEAFCEWLSRKEGRSYRLPTGIEWEWAARGGVETPWYFGEDLLWVGEHAVVQQGGPSQVGTKLRNGFGLYDILGNVWEMTADQVDPVNAIGAVRGGAFGTGLDARFRVAAIEPWPEHLPAVDVGVRVVADLPRRAAGP